LPTPNKLLRYCNLHTFDDGNVVEGEIKPGQIREVV
jgi:hypothetical protein